MNLQLIYASKYFNGKDKFASDKGVIIRQSKILDVGRKDELLQKYSNEEIDIHSFEDCTLLPGLIDSHTHLIMPGTGVNLTEYIQNPDEVLFHVAASNAKMALKAGVTTVVDLGSKNDLSFFLREAIDAGNIQGSRLLLCGKALTITGGHGSQWGGEVDGIENLRFAVRELCKKGSDIIKIMTTARGLPGDQRIYPAYSEDLNNLIFQLSTCEAESLILFHFLLKMRRKVSYMP